jgi:hypothetical protein
MLNAPLNVEAVAMDVKTYHLMAASCRVKIDHLHVMLICAVMEQWLTMELTGWEDDNCGYCCLCHYFGSGLYSMNLFGFEIPNQFQVSISGIWNWYQDRKIKRDIANIKKWGSDYGDYKCDAGGNGTAGADYAGTGIDEGGAGCNGARDRSREEKDGA